MTVITADCIEAMRGLDEASVDAIVCDPPYHLTFMGRSWDHAPTGAESQRMHLAWATEALRVLKPGGHLLAFGGTRTYHRLACAVEDAGFEIRDSLIWLYGQGFPKSLNVGCRCENGGHDGNGEASTEHDLRAVRDADVSEAVPASAGEGSLLLAGVSKSSTSTEGAVPAARSAGEAERLVEGRGDVLAEGGQLSADQVRPSTGMGEADGTQGRLPDGAPAPDGADGRTAAHTSGVRSPSRPRPDEQREGELGALADQPGSQAGGGWPLCPRCGLPTAGLGTALKPAHEPIVCARKPLAGTVAANVEQFGTGALNVDGCRVGASEDYGRSAARGDGTTNKGEFFSGDNGGIKSGDLPDYANPAGRWPANVVLSHPPGCKQVGERKVRGGNDPRGSDGAIYAGMWTDGERPRVATEAAGYADPDGTETIPAYVCEEGCPVAELDQQSGELHSQDPATRNSTSPRSGVIGFADSGLHYGDTGGASRFFYVAKASRAERNAGLGGFEERTKRILNGGIPSAVNSDPRGMSGGGDRQARNHHPTVKPIALMRWLVRLVTPPGGTVLDPFLGSGTTGIAATLEGFDFIGIEREAEYAEIAQARIDFWAKHPGAEVEDVLASDAQARAIEATGQLGLEIA